MTDDPRLTAFALGELEGAELRELEAWIARDPEVEAEVEAIERTSALLRDALVAYPGSLPMGELTEPLSLTEAATRAATPTQATTPTRGAGLAPSRPALLAFAAAAAMLLAVLAGFEADPRPTTEARKMWLPAPSDADYFEPSPAEMPMAERDDPGAPIQCTGPSDDSADAFELLEAEQLLEANQGNRALQIE